MVKDWIAGGCLGNMEVILGLRMREKSVQQSPSNVDYLITCDNFHNYHFFHRFHFFHNYKIF